MGGSCSRCVCFAMLHLCVCACGCWWSWAVAERDVGNLHLKIHNTFGEKHVHVLETGGGEDIDYCRRKREFSLRQGGAGFFAAPAVKVTHPWWHGGKRTYWRFYMWSKGDGRLVKLYPEHTYRDFSPNAAECVLGCVLVLILGFLELHGLGN